MIAKNLWSCCLLIIILVQSSWSRPAPENDFNNLSFVKSKDACLQKAKYDQLESAKRDDASIQLIKFTLNAFQNLALDSVNKAKAISEDILKQADISDSQLPKIIKFQKNLTHFEEKFSSCNGVEDLFGLVEIFFNITEHYLDSEKDILDDDDKLIADLLRKYGAEDLENKALGDLKEFVKNFNEKFENLKDDLNKEKGAVGQKLLQWYKTFENLSDNEEKIEAFAEFFATFDEDEE